MMPRQPVLVSQSEQDDRTKGWKTSRLKNGANSGRRMFWEMRGLHASHVRCPFSSSEGQFIFKEFGKYNEQHFYDLSKTDVHLRISI
jgi:hypothetical protein